MNKITLYTLTYLIVVISWAKAGLAGDWILFTIDGVVLLSLFALFSCKHSFKFCLVCFLPILLLCLQFSISYLNPTYKILDIKEWGNLNVEKSLSEETNIEKIIMVSETFRNISDLSLSESNLCHTVFFDFKNRYFDKFPQSKSPCTKLILDYENKITLTPNSYLPTLFVSSETTLFAFIHKICQLSVGVIFFILLNDRKIIRKLLLIITLNSGLLAIVGIWQKLNYIPSDNLLEILGIWDTPEPRYYFSTFTYKNHWSAFAIVIISIAIGLLVDNFRRYRLDSFRKVKSYLLFLSIIFTAISIPLSGSRSGTILLILTTFILSITIFKFFAHTTLKKWSILLFSLVLSFSLILFFTKKLHPETSIEMVTNLKTQFNQLSEGKLPLRVLLWNDLIKQISQKPFYGYGFNSYRTINPKYQSKDVRILRNIVLANAHHRYTPLIGFGHNDWLEKISEFGFLGLIISIPYLVILTFNLFKTNSLLSRVLSLGGVIFLIYSIIDFPSQTPLSLIIFSTLIGVSIKYSYLLRKKLNMH